MSEPTCPNCGCAEIRLGECQCVCHRQSLLSPEAVAICFVMGESDERFKERTLTTNASKPKESFTVPVFAESEKRFAERVYTICKREVR